MTEDTTAILAELIAAGVEPYLVARVAKAIAAAESIEKRRAAEAERKRKYREQNKKKSDDVPQCPGTSRDVPGQAPPSPSSSPLHPPITTPSPVLGGGGGSAGARDASPAEGEARQTGEVVSLVSVEAHALVVEVAAIAGVPTGDDTPPGWCGAAMTVQAWLSQGCSAELIRIAARSAMASKRDGPPSSVAYFARPVARERQRQQQHQQLPTVDPNPPGGSHARSGTGVPQDRSVVSAARRLADRIAALDRPADSSHPSPDAARLLPQG